MKLANWIQGGPRDGVASLWGLLTLP